MSQHFEADKIITPKYSPAGLIEQLQMFIGKMWSVLPSFWDVQANKLVEKKTYVITLNDDRTWIYVDNIYYPLSTLTAVRIKGRTSNIVTDHTYRIIIWIKAGDSCEERYETALMPASEARALHRLLVGNFTGINDTMESVN